MGPSYAASTTVSSEQSRMEIERTLKRYGADAFAYMSGRDRAAIEFAKDDRRVRFVLAMPDPDSDEFVRHSRGKRTAEQALKLYEQATRQRWRALALVVKAKLEAVEAGISEFEDEFLANIVLPGGGTVADQVRPAVAEAYLTGKVRPLLELGSGR
jgi:hypothetical protein